MATIKKVISVENTLEAIFDQLPVMKYTDSSTNKYKPKFDYGDNKDLLSFLKLKGKEREDPYPLIWLEYPFMETHYDNKMEAKGISLILAVKTNTSMTNRQRLKETYRNVINPLFDNVRHSLKMGNIVNVSGIYQGKKFPNYSSSQLDEEHKTVAIWDAFKITFDIEIVSDINCLRPIKF